ncbi:hypothetical protein ACFOET_20005 [Parapedobacter deserti]|uniref:Lipocalin-like domain-containing protein n=1 Tax=Parapedobacter deserti TaxID=1912957 RepID=A0ABV7JPI0_9SPHI
MATHPIKHYLMLAIGLIVFAACSKNDLAIDPNNPLLGTWVQAGSEENAVIYTRASRLKNDDYGMIFQANGQVVMRQIAGWCATPPVAYANYEGRWNQSGATLQVTTHYEWMPSETKQTWQILSIDSKRLVLAYQ